MKKNETKLSYKEEPFIVWQDSKLSWFFSYRNLENVNTGHHELQSALNVIYESIDDKTKSFHRKAEWNTKSRCSSPISSSKPINILDKL